LIVRFAKLKNSYIIPVLAHPPLALTAMARRGFISAGQVKLKKLNGKTEEIHYHLERKTMKKANCFCYPSSAFDTLGIQETPDGRKIYLVNCFNCGTTLSTSRWHYYALKIVEFFYPKGPSCGPLSEGENATT